ncbi:MAG: protein BatD [Ignavibacteriae bacterium]|nr:protein BatD [Ignavibacteriota bacterium]
MKKIFFITLLFLTTSINLFAQEFSASIDKSTIGQNERFQIYFTYKGGNLNALSNFKAPSFKGIRILSGPNESKSMQIINGQVAGSITFSYIAVGSSLGKFNIGSASAKANGKTYTTKPIEFNIIKSTQTNAKVDSDLGMSKKELNKNVFIRANPNKHTAFLGEQITVTYKLYTKLNISSPQISKLPTFSGFWSEELDAVKNISFEIEMYKGERYRAAVIKKVALFPSKTGNLSLTPFELKVPVIVKSKKRRNAFDDFFNDSFFGRSQTIEHVAKSNKIKIKVKPLPTVNVPSSFSGGVGNFDFDVKLDKQDVELNEAISVKIKISGTGNIALLKLPEINFPAGFEKYEPKTSERINKKNIVSGRKNIEFLIVPRVPGLKEIPPIEFSYFDLKKKRYVTKTSEVFKVNIKEGEGGYNQNIAGYSKEDVKLLNEDIRFIKSSSFSFQRKEGRNKISILFWLGLILPLGALLALLFVQNKQNKLAGNISLLKFQKADKKANQLLGKATKSLESNNLQEYYNYLSQALFGYLEDKLGIQKADFTIDKAVEKLKEKNASHELIKNLKQVSEKCEFARFAPDAVGNDADKQFYKSVESIIQNISSTIS